MADRDPTVQQQQQITAPLLFFFGLALSRLSVGIAAAEKRAETQRKLFQNRNLILSWCVTVSSLDVVYPNDKVTKDFWDISANVDV